VVIGGGSWERKVLFVDAHLMFLANAAHAAQYKERMVAYMIYYVIAYVTLFCLYIRFWMSTSLKSNTIAPPTPKQLKDKEFEEWKRGF
jgi:hypothetical protein